MWLGAITGASTIDDSTIGLRWGPTHISHRAQPHKIAQLAALGFDLKNIEPLNSTVKVSELVKQNWWHRLNLIRKTKL